MKDLAQRADVSLATLYRYFPSKDHVLLAISLDNYQAAARKVLQEVLRGKTARERVTNHMLREFRAQQRNQRLTTALTKVLTETSRNYSEIIEVIGHVHVQILQHVAAAGPAAAQRAAAAAAADHHRQLRLGQPAVADRGLLGRRGSVPDPGRLPPAGPVGRRPGGRAGTGRARPDTQPGLTGPGFLRVEFWHARGQLRRRRRCPAACAKRGRAR